MTVVRSISSNGIVERVRICMCLHRRELAGNADRQVYANAIVTLKASVVQ